MYSAVSFNYPYGVENEKKWQLNGELYELTSTKIEKIDIFEGAPDYYFCKEIEFVGKKNDDFLEALRVALVLKK
ncbi:MAG: hypothetical protein COB17_10610 [Sulfurimonas sp.]|nr:MAG: hypothetical protein COB17_10610 [Sulfurimonas sp.]